MLVHRDADEFAKNVNVQFLCCPRASSNLFTYISFIAQKRKMYII